MQNSVHLCCAVWILALWWTIELHLLWQAVIKLISLTVLLVCVSFWVKRRFFKNMVCDLDHCSSCYIATDILYWKKMYWDELKILFDIRQLSLLSLLVVILINSLSRILGNMRMKENKPWKKKKKTTDLSQRERIINLI